jgi:hypothetical protein
MLNNAKLHLSKFLVVDFHPQDRSIELRRSSQVSNGNVKPDGSVMLTIEVAHIVFLEFWHGTCQQYNKVSNHDLAREVRLGYNVHRPQLTR